MSRAMGRPAPEELSDEKLMTELRFWRGRLRVAVASKEVDYVKAMQEEVDKYEAVARERGLI